MEGTQDRVPPKDLTLVEENSLSSSISLSIGECSMRLKEKSSEKSDLPDKHHSPSSHHHHHLNQEGKWWLKKPDNRLGGAAREKSEVKSIPSPEITSSMREFLEKEKYCKSNPLQRSAAESNYKDDTLCDIQASAAFRKDPSDFENETDEDIESILGEMSKIVEGMSPNSAPECTKSGDSSKIPMEEKSVEEILEEAQKLVQINAGLSKSASRSDTLSAEVYSPGELDSNRAQKLEDDIFHMIQQEVHKESEKLRKSPRTENKRTASPGFEIVYENMSSLKTPWSLELQKKRFEEQKVEVSSSSDLDDPIERHSNCEDLKAVKKGKEKEEWEKEEDEEEKEEVHLHQEITEVDKHFFDEFLRRSKKHNESGISGSPSFDQEDFSHFVKILQRKSDAKDSESKARNGQTEKPLDVLPNNPKDSEYPEAEVAKILENEFSKNKTTTNHNEIIDSDSSCSNERSQKFEKPPLTRDSTFSRNSSKDRSKQSDKSQRNKSEIIKVSNSQNDLYTVGLPPRLELFADVIPKLIAQKSLEKLQKSSPSTPVTESKEKVEEGKPKQFDADERQISGYHPLSPENNKRDSRVSEKNLKPTKSLDKKTTGKPGNPEPSRNVPKSISSKNMSIVNSKFNLLAKQTFQKQQSSSKFLVRGKTPESILKSSLSSGDVRKNLTKNDFEILYQEERHKNSLLRNQIDVEAQLYKQQIQSMRTSFEEDLFALKKQTIIQKAKIDELSLNFKDRQEKRTEAPGSKAETKVLLLEKELGRQESMILTYETENKKLMQENKRLQEELKNVGGKLTGREAKQMSEDENEIQKLSDNIKDLREEILKLNLELTDLRTKNTDAAMKNDDLLQQTSLLEEELTMFKDQLKTKDRFITDRLKSMSIHEMETRRKMEEIKIELISKTEKLKVTKTEFDKFQQAIMPLEKELLDLRSREQNLQEKLQVSKSHVEREKVLTQKLKDQVILDNKKILDLNRQVREMERILKRKNPDSVSALILTARSDNERINLEKVKLLEDRIAFLEGEMKVKEELGQENLTELQMKFAEMKEKYSIQVADLEDKLREALIKESTVLKDMCTQTIASNMESKSVETKREEKVALPEREEKKESRVIRVGPKSQNLKEDAHLLATIRGLKLELANKDKNLTKLMKEIQDTQKTNRRLQKEREKLLDDRRNIRPEEKTMRPTSAPRNSETNDQNSNICPNSNGHFPNSNGQKFSISSQKLYDPLQYSETGENVEIKRLNSENQVFKGELEKMNKDFITLKNRRLQDLNLLQEEHEREMANLVKEYSVKFGDSKVIKLQGQINTQIAIISHLKSEIEKLRDYKEQVIVLKVEREHLENKVKILNEKVRYLSTPGTEQLGLLQDKINTLQQRHESREMTLQNLVRDLLRNKTQCFNCKGEKGKNRQLCYFRRELDNILGMLQEISNFQ